MDSLYKGDKLIKIKERLLKQFQIIAPYWDNWELENRSDTLKYLRDIYIKGSNEYIVMLCYDLYQLSKRKDQKFIQIAFDAQENSKYRILKKRLIQSYNLKNEIETNIDTIQKVLLPNEGVISFSDIGSYYRNYYAIIISKNKKGFLKFHTYGDYNFESIFNLNYTLKDISSFKNSYFKAYNLIFKNVLPYLNTTTDNLLILNSKNSSRFRFNLMISDTSGYKSFSELPYIANKYLFKYDFSYQISQLRNKIISPPCIDNQVYIPNYSNSSFYTLPFFEQIGTGLKKDFNFNVFNHSNATVENFRNESKNANLLLIGAHGYSNSVSADEIKIIMDSSKETQSASLTPFNIINNPLRTNLTILAICESGVSDFWGTEDYLNLPYWFSYAGSKSCLSSFWKLDDRSTAIIVENYLKKSLKGYSKSKALWLAKQDYLNNATTEEERNPIYWGGLELIGDDNPLIIQTQKPGFNRYYLFLGLLIPIMYFFYRKNR